LIHPVTVMFTALIILSALVALTALDAADV
jgi:hypothetical protein